MAQNTAKSKSQKENPQAGGAGVFILQWLTYAFWGWLIVGLIWLMSVILASALTGASTSSIVPYAIAASVVMLPLAFTTDFFYRKYEPVHKTGAATVIMVIHAVIFALLGIGALITTVFTGLNALINSTDSSDAVTVVVLTAGFATLLFGAAFLRTLNPFKKPAGSRLYAFSMLGVTVLLLILAIVGPVATTIATRDDRRLEQALPTVERAIDSYVMSQNKLPASLDDITIRERNTRDLIKAGEITYIPEDVAVEIEDGGLTSRTYFRYQLCVEYDRPSENSDYDDYYSPSEEDGYKSFLQATPHDEGETCYKLRAYERK